MVQFTEVVAAGPGWTTVRTDDGRTVTLQGARNWRNNNPGNLEYGPTARGYGAVGTDGRFAVFNDYSAGRAAKEGLLFDNSRYSTLSISDAIARYAPPVENNTTAYVNAITNAIGVPASTPLSDLTEEQRSTMLDTMQRVEGFRPGTAKGILGDPLDENTLQIDPQYGSIPDNVPVPEMRPGLGQVDSTVGMMSTIDPVSVTPVQRGILDAPQTQTAGLLGPSPTQPEADYSAYRSLATPMTTMDGLRSALAAQQEKAQAMSAPANSAPGGNGLLGPMTDMAGLRGALAAQTELARAQYAPTEPAGFGLIGTAEAAQPQQPEGPSPATMAEQYGQYGQGQLAMQAAQPQAAAPAAPSTASLAEQYGQYGAGQLAMQDALAASNLAADVADQRGLLSSVKTDRLAAAPAVQPGYVDPVVTAQPTYTQPAPQPAPQIAPAAPAAPARPAVEPKGTVGGTPTGAALGALVERQMNTRSLLGGIGGGLLGGALLGPVGAALGGLLGRNVANRTYHPPAPEAPKGGARGSDYGDLNERGRETYGSSEQFRDAVDSGVGGLW